MSVLHILIFWEEIFFLVGTHHNLNIFFHTIFFLSISSLFFPFFLFFFLFLFHFLYHQFFHFLSLFFSPFLSNYLFFSFFSFFSFFLTFFSFFLSLLFLFFSHFFFYQDVWWLALSFKNPENYQSEYWYFIHCSGFLNRSVKTDWKWIWRI